MTALGQPRLVLPPVLNPHYQEVVTRPLFDAEQCATIRALVRDGEWEAAGVTGPRGSGDAYDAKVRSATLGVLPDDGSWPLDALVDALGEINSEVYRFALVGLFGSDRPSVARYRSQDADHFRPHQDAGGVHARRKLTYVVQLSPGTDYQGGDLVFGERGKVAPRDQGTLVVFPSTLTHVVTPVISGERQVVVGWVHGPTLS